MTALLSKKFQHLSYSNLWARFSQVLEQEKTFLLLKKNHVVYISHGKMKRKITYIGKVRWDINDVCRAAMRRFAEQARDSPSEVARERTSVSVKRSQPDTTEVRARAFFEISLLKLKYHFCFWNIWYAFDVLNLHFAYFHGIRQWENCRDINTTKNPK